MAADGRWKSGDLVVVQVRNDSPRIFALRCVALPGQCDP